MTRALLTAAVAIALFGCVEDLEVLSAAPATFDGGPGDGGPEDARADGGTPDAGPPVDQAPSRLLTAGDSHSCVIVSGNLYCWGGNDSGQLGLGDTTSRASAEVVGMAGGWTQIVAGARHTCGARADGTVQCWGANANGQLGTGDTDPRTTPASVALAPVYLLETSQSHTCAIDGARQLFCWGENGEGEIGLDDWPPIFVLSPVRVGDGAEWTDVSTGQGHTVGILSGAAYGWGRNDSFQLGLGAGAPIQRRAPTWIAGGPFREVSAGQDYSCAIDASDDLWCWGENYGAALGTGDRTTRETPVVVAGTGDWITVDVDTFHTCGLRRPGTLWCWGRGIEGQLGTGDLDDRLVPTQVGTDADWIAVAIGRFHTCAQRADLSVWCMGANDEGRLGTGDTDRRNVPAEVVVIR